MSDDNTNVNDTDDLEAFEADFYGESVEAAPEPETEDHEEDADPLEPEADEDAEDEDEGDEPEDESEDDEEEEEEAPQKPNRKSAKERITELVAKTREAERREQTLLQRIEAMEAAVAEKSKATEKPLRDILPDDAPSPDATGEDGEALYPLGEFDPLYIRDLTKFTIESETKAAKERAEQESVQKQIESEREELQEQWISRLDEVEEELPDIRERITDLTDTFANVEPAYGEYLATLLMGSEKGPQLMYYLSQNIGEAQKIVASGPVAATLALGRLEARFTSTAPEKKSNKKSTAPVPPETISKGRGSKFDVKDDTDDLDAFERKFYKK